jgi:transcriptional regulator with XRE-family HTH domain
MQARSGTLPFSAYTRRVSWTGRRLRDARARRGWTQARAAEELGAGQRTWAAWERDEAKPQAHWIAKLDDLFNETSDAAEQAPIDPHTIEQALRHATVLELLAELAGRYAALEAANQRGGQPAPPGEPERYTWYKSDAPTARRGVDLGDSKETASGAAAELETYEWTKTTNGTSGRTGDSSA